MKQQTVSTTEFFDYLLFNGLFRWSIKKNKTGFVAIVTSQPKLENFTQVKQLEHGLYEARLSRSDLHNDKITKSFFLNYKF